MVAGIVIGCILAVLIIVGGIASYVKAPPDTAYFVTGFRKKRILIGQAGFRIPFFERLDKVPLNLMQVDVKTSSPVPTNEFININVDGVANVKISQEVDMLEKAAQIFLAENINGIKSIVKEVLDGNMREIIGQMRLTDLVHNRDEFANKVKDSAMEDMRKMGLEIINITIQNFTDKDGVIDNLGIDNISQIRKGAEIAKANSIRDVAIAKSLADEEANRARIEAETKITEQNTSLSLRQAELKIKSDTAQADADAAYEIKKQLKQKDINNAKIDAEIAKREREVELGNKEVELKERQLDAEIKKKADADKYAKEQQASADLFIRQKASEAKKYEEAQIAEILKIKADAGKYEIEKAAEAEKARAEADKFAQLQRAEGIEAVGKAEAEAIEAKAEAMKRMEQAAILELVLKSDVLPKIVTGITEPIASALAQVDSITMYGEGNTAKLTEEITRSTTQVFKGVQDATGIDLKNLLTGLAGGFLGGKLFEKQEEK